MPAKGEKNKGRPFQFPDVWRNIVMLHMASHPFRYSILKELARGRPLYINQLRRRIGISRRMVGFHLMDLEKFKLVKTYMDYLGATKSPRRAVLARFARITPRGTKMLAGIDQVVRPPGEQ